MALTIDEDLEKRVREVLAGADRDTPEDFIHQAVEDALLEQMLLDGIASGNPVEATPEFWEQMKRDLEARHQEKR